MDTRKRKIRQYLFRVIGIPFIGVLCLVGVFISKPGRPGFIFSLIGIFLALLLISFYTLVLVGLFIKNKSL